MSAPTLPDVTDAHRRAAFQRLALRGWSYDAARADPLRCRAIEALAHSIRTAEWRAQHRRNTQPVRRINPATGQWCTQRAPGDWDAQQTAIDTENHP